MQQTFGLNIFGRNGLPMTHTPCQSLIQHYCIASPDGKCGNNLLNTHTAHGLHLHLPRTVYHPSREPIPRTVCTNSAIVSERIPELNHRLLYHDSNMMILKFRKKHMRSMHNLAVSSSIVHHFLLLHPHHSKETE